MTAKERAQKAEAIRKELAGIPAPGYSNYQALMAEYRRIVNDILVLIRDDALAEDAALTDSTKHLPMD